jgi:hypothetical protein
MAKREKHYFTSKEIAHVFCNRGSTNGRCPGNMSFNGDKFYSYSTVITRRLTYKGKTAYIIDNGSFSVSTSRHRSYVRYAIRNEDKKFFVYIGKWGQQLDFTPQDLRDYYLNKFSDDSKTSPFAHKRASLFLSRIGCLEEAIDICKYFGLAVAKLQKQLADLQPDTDNFTKVLREYNQNKINKQNERDRKQKEIRISRALLYAQSVISGESKIDNFPIYEENLLTDYPDIVAKVQKIRFEKDKKDIESWIAGTSDKTDHNWPVYLRTNLYTTNHYMETSKGARVLLSDAEKSFRFVIALKNKNEQWHRDEILNSGKHKIGMYRLDAVNSSGVVAGCHRVSWEEIERFAKSQGW